MPLTDVQIQSQLDKLNRAIATGALVVQFQDEKVTYRSLSEMRQIRDDLTGQLAGNGGRRTRQIRMATRSGY